MENIKKLLEEREAKTLCKYATLSQNTKGREREISPCNLRTEFQRDRDKILQRRFPAYVYRALFSLVICLTSVSISRRMEKENI